MESKFTGNILEYIGISIITSVIIVFTFGIATPWAVCMYQSWRVKNTVIDGHQLTFDGNGTQLFAHYIKWFLLTLVTFGIYGLWLSLKMEQWVAKHTHMVAAA